MLYIFAKWLPLCLQSSCRRKDRNQLSVMLKDKLFLEEWHRVNNVYWLCTFRLQIKQFFFIYFHGISGLSLGVYNEFVSVRYFVKLCEVFFLLFFYKFPTQEKDLMFKTITRYIILDKVINLANDAKEFSNLKQTYASFVMELYEKCRVTEILKKQGTIFISFSREILFNLDIPLSNGNGSQYKRCFRSRVKISFALWYDSQNST